MKRALIVFCLVLSGFFLVACTPPANKLYNRGEAQYRLQNYQSAFTTLIAAAKSGNVPAMYAVGYMYYYGIGVDRDPAQAIKWLKKSAYFGNVNAINALQSIEQNAPKPFNFGHSG